MKPRSTFSAISDFFVAFGSAVAVSSAVEGNRKPRAIDLRRLGIDPEQFRTIRR